MFKLKGKQFRKRNMLVRVKRTHGYENFFFNRETSVRREGDPTKAAQVLITEGNQKKKQNPRNWQKEKTKEPMKGDVSYSE